MKKCKKINPKFISGEAYLFRCHHNPTIIGIFDKCQDGIIVLESATYTSNYREFVLYKALPPQYRFWRKAYRSELRDYIYNLALYEMYLYRFNCINIVYWENSRHYLINERVKIK